MANDYVNLRYKQPANPRKTDAFIREQINNGVYLFYFFLDRFQTYPDEGHTFDGSMKHLLHAMEHFWDECFGPLDFDDWDESLNFFAFTQ